MQYAAARSGPMRSWTLGHLVEQLRDIYCGRATYRDDEEWVANLDVVVAELSVRFALDFRPQAPARRPRSRRRRPR